MPTPASQARTVRGGDAPSGGAGEECREKGPRRKTAEGQKEGSRVMESLSPAAELAPQI